MGEIDAEGGRKESEAEENFRVLAEYSPNMIFINQQGRVVYANRKCEEELGYTREEFYSPDFDFLSLITPETQHLVMESFEKHMKGEDAPQYEYGLVRKDGGKMDVIISSKLISLQGESAILGVVTDITERRNVEEALKESEERYGALVENTSDGVIIIQDGQLKYVNSEYLNSLGYTKEEMTGADFLDFVAPEYRETVMQRYLDRLAGEDVPSSYEIEIQKKDGTRFPVEVNAAVIEYEGEEAEMVSVRDITERKRAEQALQESDAKYSTLVERANDGVVIVQDGVFKFVNEAAAKVAGSNVDSLTGTEFLDLVAPEDRDSVAERYSARMAGKPVAPTFEFRILDKDGKNIVIELSAALIQYQGRPANMGVFRDITKRKHTEEELKRSEEKYRSLVEKAGAGIATSDIEGNFSFVNEELCRMTGYSQEEMIGKPFIDFVHPDDHEMILEVFLGASEKPDEEVDLDFRIVRKGGEVHSFHSKPTVLWHGDEIAGFNAIITNITKTKQAERALKDSEERLKQAQKMGRIGDWEFDVGTQKIAWSDQAFELFERDPSLGPPDFEENMTYYYPEDSRRLQKQIQDAVRNGKAFESDYHVKLPSGKSVYHSGTINPIKDSEGRVVKLVGTVQDITERKRSEEPLNKRTYDLGERVKEMNCLYSISRLLQIPDTPMDELFQGIIELTPPSMQYPEITRVRISLEGQDMGKGSCEGAVRELASDIHVHDEKIGSLRICYMEERPEIDEGPFLKEERALINAIADQLGRTIEYQRSQEELRRSEERFKIMFDYAPDAYVLTDSEGLLVDGNRAAEELLGFSKDESLGDSLVDLGAIPEDQIEKTRENLIDTINGKPTGPDEVTLIGRDGRRITAETRTYPVRIDGQDMMLATARDITERKHVEEAKNNFLSNISHELRTPLTSIEGYTKFILSGKLGDIPENHEKCLRVIDEESGRLKGLIDNFLDLLTIDAEGLRMKLERIPVAQMIDALISSLNLQLEMKGISFSTEIQEDLGFIKGDQNRLHQLFSNLLSNAIKFTPQGGSIAVRFREKDSDIIVEVEDSGVGILPEDLSHIFDRFYQVDGSPSRKFGGVGLGLAICNEIVEAHGGHMEVESLYGKGSIFRVELPKYPEVSHGEEESNGS